MDELVSTSFSMMSRTFDAVKVAESDDLVATWTLRSSFRVHEITPAQAMAGKWRADDHDEVVDLTAQPNLTQGFEIAGRLL
jgi:hypothetical protein